MEAANKKLTFEIIHDSNAENPFTAWDGTAPIMYELGRHNQKTDFSDGRILEAIQEAATNGRIIRYGNEILEILNTDFEYYKDDTKEDKIDFIRDEIDRATVKELGELCELLNLPYKQYTSRGYLQGDWADVLIVLTPDFYEETGAPKNNSQKDLEGASNLFDSWAWGDVYGFRIFEETFCECCGELQKDEIDSCWGFYGNDFENNGMIEHFPEELKEELKNFDSSDIKY